MPEDNYFGIRCFPNGINETMSLPARGHRILWLVSKARDRGQGSLFPVVLDDLVPVNHMCRVVDAFVAMLALSELGFERALAAETGRPGHDPRDLLKLYLYDYLNQIRSSLRYTN